MRGRIIGQLVPVLLLLSGALCASPEGQIQVVTDSPSYNVGSVARLEIIFPSSDQVLPASEFLLTLRYAGDNEPVLDQVSLSSSRSPSSRSDSTGYRQFWKIPQDAKTGRYEIDLTARGSGSRRADIKLRRAASLVVYRKLIRIDEVRLGKTFYASGDAVSCVVRLRNNSDRDLSGLRVEFSDRYWPWIGAPDGANLHILPLSRSFSLPAHDGRELSSSRAAVAETVTKPSVHQYAVIVWDRERKNIYDIAFSPLAFIEPPGVDSPRPYPGQYAYSDLTAINHSNYRRFYPKEFVSSAITFDRSHTMWPAGGEAKVLFSVANPAGQFLRGVQIRVQLASPQGAEIASKVAAEAIDLDAGGPPIKDEVAFRLPNEAGVYQAIAAVSDRSGNVLASNTLELGVNPLPKSILVFCAHEDDEGGRAGLYRAAIENHIPIRFVYFTSGDAGSCDRYYQHSCGPAEALNFGAIRMQEARAALGHLGVPPEDILFFGLPDGGSGEIWSNHVAASDPYLDELLATDHAPYEGLVRPNLPFARDSVVETAKGLIEKFQPELIYTAHPGDVRHIDHIVNGYFVIKALQQLRRQGAALSNLRLLADEVRDPKLQPSTPYRYQSYVLHVSGEAKALAQEAVWFHQSQGAHTAGSIRTFDQLPRTEGYRQVLDWQEHEGWNEKH